MVYQIIATVVILLIAALVPKIDSPALRNFSRKWNRFARRKHLAIASVGVAGFLMPAGMSLVVGVPVPAVHDEFAYLLGADTFAQGRLTNPTHPLWESFETFHVIFQPTYQMKYPPGQSLLLALGQVLGHPVIGVWLGVALAAAATCWMMYGWVPPRWALLGGVLMLLNFYIIRWWGQIYWGGALAMCGGALLYGALPRLRRHPRISTSILMAIGIAILANTRPYEGLIASLVALAAIIAWLISRNRPPFSILATRFILPTVAVLTAAGAWMGYYNYRVTGSAVKMPYQVWDATYGYGSLTRVMFSAGEAPPVKRRIPIPGNEQREANRQANAKSRNANYPMKLLRNWTYYLGPLLTLPFLLLPWTYRQRGMGFVIAAVAAVLAAAVLQNTGPHIHYAAPLAALVVLMAVQGLRHLRHSRVGDGNLGWNLVRLTLPAMVVCFLVSFWTTAHNKEVIPWSFDRVALEERLLSEDGQHLVVVRYTPQHDINAEWVYNSANIDAQPIIWARELTPEKNVELVEHYPDRRIWLAEPDTTPPLLTEHKR